MNWTDGRIKGFITSILRSGFRKWPPKYITLNNAKCGKKINEKTGRIAEHYLCNGCKKEYPAKEVQVDHVLPVVDLKKGFVNWDTFIKRLYCPEENLQVLCLTCHKRKTEKERKIRK